MAVKVVAEQQNARSQAPNNLCRRQKFVISLLREYGLALLLQSQRPHQSARSVSWRSMGGSFTRYEAFPASAKIDEIQTGDLLYFCCYNSWTDYLIMLFNSHNLITHVGMAVRRGNQVLVMEAVRNADVKTSCRLCKSSHEGVRLVPLLDKMSAKSSFVSNWVIVQRLRVSETVRAAAAIALESFLRRADACEYTHHPVCMCMTPITGPPGQGWGDSADRSEDGRKRYFCSSLVADAYRAMALLEPSWNPWNTMPRDFIEGSVTLTRGSSLSPKPYYIFPSPWMDRAAIAPAPGRPNRPAPAKPKRPPPATPLPVLAARAAAAAAVVEPTPSSSSSSSSSGRTVRILSASQDET